MSAASTSNAPRTAAARPVGRLGWGAVVVLAVALLTFGGWLVGRATAPTPADARREQAASRTAAYERARTSAAGSAYADAFAASFPTGATAGRIAGAADGRAAAASR